MTAIPLFTRSIRSLPVVTLLVVAPLVFSARSHAHELASRVGVPGGLVVHLGVGDGVFKAEEYTDDRYIVHGLDVSAEAVTAARTRVRSLGEYGRVSIATFDGKQLPYANGLVNVVVADEQVLRPQSA